MARWVQDSSGALSTMTWYKADTIENNANYLWPFNSKGNNVGYKNIEVASTYKLYITVPSAGVNLLGVILGIRLTSYKSYNLSGEITVDLEEDSGGGYAVVRSKALTLADITNNAPPTQYGFYIVDFRFDDSYYLDPANNYRIAIYRSGELNLALIFSVNGSNVTDVTNYAFRIFYEDGTGTPADGDTFVITDELRIDQNWVVGYEAIPTSPSKGGLDNYKRYVSMWIASKGRLYVPSSIANDVTVEVRGRMYFGAGYRVSWQIGDSESNPIPANRRVYWYFNTEGTSQRAGVYGYAASWGKWEFFGSSVSAWYADIKYDASAGASQVVVRGDVTSEWATGDTIAISGTQYSSTRHYYDFSRDRHCYSIVSLSYDAANDETTIEITPSLYYMKRAGGKVILLRRNVRVYGDSVSTTQNRACGYTITYSRGGEFHNVHFRYLYQFPHFRYYAAQTDLATYPHRLIIYGCLFESTGESPYLYLPTSHFKDSAWCSCVYSGYNYTESRFTIERGLNSVIENTIHYSWADCVYSSGMTGVEFKNMWLQGQYVFNLKSIVNCKFHDITIFGSRVGFYLGGAVGCEFYNITGKGIHYDSNYTSETGASTGFVTYIPGFFNVGNKFHDCNLDEVAFVFQIVNDAGSKDWYHNIAYGTVYIGLYSVNFRTDWLEGTEVRFTKKNGVQYDDWVIFKYGDVHRTGNYTNADDTRRRTEGGKNYALRLTPKLTGEDFSEYKVPLTGCLSNRPVYYVGYMYVTSDYYSGSDVNPPEIYLEGLGIDPTSETTAKWTHPGSSYADKWVPFVVVGTPSEDGIAYAVFKLRSDASNAYVYIDDDAYSWAENVDYRSHEAWVDGAPAYPPSIFPNITPLEVWNQVTQVLKTTGTMGHLLSRRDGFLLPHTHTVKVNTPVEFVVLACETATVELEILDLDGNQLLKQNMTNIPNTPLFKITHTFTSPNHYVCISRIYEHGVRDAKMLLVLSEDDYNATHADVKDLALEASVQAVKAQTDKMQFDASGNVQARVNDKGVLNDPSATEIASAVDTQLSSTHGSGSWEGASAEDVADAVWDEPASEHTTDGTFGAKNQRVVPSENVADYRADVSSLALESTVQSIKAQTDKLQFNADNDVKATLDGETVTLDSTTQSKIDLIYKVEKGRWRITNNQLIMYDEDGTTELLKFDLYDQSGQPTEINVYERRPTT